MTPRFIMAMGVVLNHEGGLSDDPNDRGGKTRWGISSRWFPDVETFDEALGVYYSEFWIKESLQLEELARISLSVAAKTLDVAVNMGQRTGAQLLQEALTLLRWLIEVDGVLGPITRGLVVAELQAHTGPQHLLATISGLQFEHYRRITLGGASQAGFLTGWTKRAYTDPRWGWMT